MFYGAAGILSPIFYKLKYLIMRFISMPANGSSWRGCLPYRFATDSGEVEDVTVEIFDATANVLLGTMRLYGVVEAEVDIASYIRPHLSLMQVEAVRQIELVTSPSAIAVVVRVNGADSERRVFFRSQFDYSSIGPLSNHVLTQDLLLGDAVRLTLFAASEISVLATVQGTKSLTLKSMGSTRGMPMELVVPTSQLVDVERISLSIRLDNTISVQYDYVVTENMSRACRLLWYNAIGGIDSFIFDHAKRLNYCVRRTEVHMCKEKAKSVEGYLRYRLCSGYELQQEMERVAQLLLSPVVFAEVGGSCRVVEVDSSDVAYDNKGMLHSIALNISEKWKGGDVVW